jgi:hypothetical protein
MAGDRGQPYRPPCIGWDNLRLRPGDCHQHRKANEDNLAVIENTTIVPDWRGTSDPARNADGISPYPRPNDKDCEGQDDASKGCNPGNETPHQACGPWIRFGAQGKHWLPPIADCAGGIQAIIDSNCYAATEQTQDRSLCWKMGFKNAIARKNWHGVFGFLSRPFTFALRPEPGCIPAKCNCTEWWNEQADPKSQTKYLKLTNDTACHHKHWDGYGQYLYNDFFDTGAVMEVGRTTGELTESDFSYTQTPGSETFWGNQTIRLGLDVAGMLERVRTIYYNYILPTDPSELTVTGCEPSYTALVRHYDVVAGVRRLVTEVNLSCEVSPTGANMVYTVGSYDPQLGFAIREREEIHISDNVSQWIYALGEDLENVGGLNPENDWSYLYIETNAYLEVPYTASDVYADLVSLLSKIDLTDDAKYPWRTDGYVTNGPLVTYREAAVQTPHQISSTSKEMLPDYSRPNGSPPYSSWGEVEWFDENIYVWQFNDAYDPDHPDRFHSHEYNISSGRVKLNDGNVTGELLPAGKGPHFDYRHETIVLDPEVQYCCSNGSPAHCNPWIRCYGGWSGNRQPNGADPNELLLPVESWDCNQINGKIQLYITDPMKPLLNIGDTVNFFRDGDTEPYVTGATVEDVNWTIGYYAIAKPPGGCSDSGSDGSLIRTKIYGGSAIGGDIDEFIPISATQWTNEWDAANLPPGACVTNLGLARDPNTGQYALAGQSVVYAMKWAEIKMPWKALNFSRPCGPDRWTPIDHTVQCLLTFDENTNTFTAGGETTLGNGDYAYVKDFTGIDDGRYLIGDTHHITQPFTAASACPTDSLTVTVADETWTA